MDNKSEFGKGFTYCIGLFLAHQFMFPRRELREGNLWFNGASDHLYELVIPDNFIMKDECEAWRSLVLEYGHGLNYLCQNNLNEKDISWAIDKGKEFLIAWDKQCGLEAIKGQWE